MLCVFMLLFFTVLVQTEKTKLKTEHSYIELQYQAPEIFTFKLNRSDLHDQPPLLNINSEQAELYLQSKPGELDLALSLLYIQNQDEKQAYQAEYYRYNNKYNLDKERQEYHFCIVSPFHNFFSSMLWTKYLNIFENMNYTNYQVVLVDDQSDDQSSQRIINLTRDQYPRIHRRLTVVKTREFTNLLGNQDFGVRNVCDNDSIVLLVDGDDTLIGRQVLNLLNAYYQEIPETWVVHTNFLYHHTDGSITKYKNQQIPEEILRNNSYRTAGIWVTSHLKTFFKPVYMKIPPSYFFRSEGRYHLYSSDFWIMMACIQFAGYGRVRYLDEFTHFYYTKPSCRNGLMMVTEQLVRMKTPFLRLNDINQEGQLTPNYKYPLKLLYEYNERLKIDKNIECLKQTRQKINDPTYMSPIPVPEEDQAEYDQIMRADLQEKRIKQQIKQKKAEEKKAAAQKKAQMQKEKAKKKEQEEKKKKQEQEKKKKQQEEKKKKEEQKKNNQLQKQQKEEEAEKVKAEDQTIKAKKEQQIKKVKQQEEKAKKMRQEQQVKMKNEETKLIEQKKEQEQAKKKAEQLAKAQQEAQKAKQKEQDQRKQQQETRIKQKEQKAQKTEQQLQKQPKIIKIQQNIVIKDKNTEKPEKQSHEQSDQLKQEQNQASNNNIKEQQPIIEEQFDKKMLTTDEEITQSNSQPEQIAKKPQQTQIMVKIINICRIYILPLGIIVVIALIIMVLRQPNTQYQKINIPKKTKKSNLLKLVENDKEEQVDMEELSQ